MLGYESMWGGRAEDAAAIQKLNLEQYPNSANAYDRYGDVMLAKDDTAAALDNFKKYFAMDSTFIATRDKIAAIRTA